MSNDREDIPKDNPIHLQPSRRERRKVAKANGVKFTPLAPQPIEALQLSEAEKTEAALLDMIDSLNALTPDSKPAWFLFGPYAFHAEGAIYLHNGTGQMEKWTVLDEEKAELARAYLRERMKPQTKGGGE